MGCKSSKGVSVPASSAAPDAAEAAPVLTEATAEERALTQLKVIFDSIGVSKDELSSALERDVKLGGLIKEAGLNETSQVLEQLDTSANGRVSYDEFVSHLKTAAVAQVEETGYVKAVELPADEKALKQLKTIFQSIDANSDGSVTKDELVAALNKDDTIGNLIAEAAFNPDYLVLEQLDTNHDQRIVWVEFVAHLRSCATTMVKDHGYIEAAVVLEDRAEIEGPVERKGWCC